MVECVIAPDPVHQDVAVLREEATLPLDGAVDARQLGRRLAAGRDERQQAPLVARACAVDRRAVTGVAETDRGRDSGPDRVDRARGVRGAARGQEERGGADKQGPGQREPL